MRRLALLAAQHVDGYLSAELVLKIEAMLIINNRLKVPLKELNFSFARSGGPGGQNVNKVNTKATLHWAVQKCESLPQEVRDRFVEKFRRRINNDGQVVIHSQRFRDQGRNVADCTNKLRDMIAEAAIRPTVRKKTKPTKGSNRRRLASKAQRSEKKQNRKPPRRDD